jgi:hypothetical protein
MFFIQSNSLSCHHVPRHSFYACRIPPRSFVRKCGYRWITRGKAQASSSPCRSQPYAKVNPSAKLLRVDSLTVLFRSSCFTCPPTDNLGFAVADHSVDSSGVLFCSYPAVAGENPNDFFCTYSTVRIVLLYSWFCSLTLSRVALLPKTIMPVFVLPAP